MKPFVHHVLDRDVCPDLATYVTRNGGKGLEVAREVEPDAIIDEIETAGLRGRGGAGFPTHIKWRTVRDAASDFEPTPVVVNAAEGEPGTFKDRALLRTNPYKVIEGALIAAVAVGADCVTIATKASFTGELKRLRGAVAEIKEAGWNGNIAIDIEVGPSSYLYGEETGLLEVLDGRQPFPRVTPPFRRGLHENAGPDGRSAVAAELAGPDLGAPVLVDNVETLANVPFIVSRGGAAFREYGTEKSPGTIICTVTGDTETHGVGEVPMGTTVRQVIDGIGGGIAEGRSILGVLAGVSGPLIPEDLLDTPLTYEDMAAAGLGLGSASLIVYDDSRDPVAIAEAVARFLSVESCGQCEPCKRDGLAISVDLGRLIGAVHGPTVLDDVRDRLRTVADGARCNLGRQTQDVVGSVLARFESAFVHRQASSASVERLVIAPVVDIVDDRALLDDHQTTKQPDWTHNATDSAAWPAARLGNTPVTIEVETRRERAGGVSEPQDRAGHPLAVLEVVHDRISDLLDQVRAAPDDHDRRDALVESLAVHCDVVSRIVVPMVRRVGGGPGDDLAWAAEGHDHTLLTTAERLRNAGPATADDLDGLAADFSRHVDIERSMADLLVRKLDRTGLERLVDAMDEGRETSLD
jgi:NADH:ubiquinone oxidoreductase subunit F (NADH-binding)